MQPPSKIAIAAMANFSAEVWRCGDSGSARRGSSTLLAALRLLLYLVHTAMKSMLLTRLKAAWAPYLRFYWSVSSYFSAMV